MTRAAVSYPRALTKDLFPFLRTPVSCISNTVLRRCPLRYLAVLLGSILVVPFVILCLTGWHTDVPPAIVAPEPVVVIKQFTPVDRWEVRTTVNALDGTRKTVVSTRDVVVRCAPEGVGYVLPELRNLGGMLEGTDDHEYEQIVRYRIDNGPLVKELWTISDDREALFFSKRALRSAAVGQKIIVEYDPEYVGREIETFDLSGLHQAMVKGGCKV